jgi:hypothetical protein
MPGRRVLMIGEDAMPAPNVRIFVLLVTDSTSETRFLFVSQGDWSL